jgi:hypothetical protein
MNERIVRREYLSRQASDWRNASECRVARVMGSLTGGMSFEEVQREYYLGIEDVLEEREMRAESGEATFSDCEKAKISIRNRLK